MEIKMHVGNLALSTTEADLRRYFSRAGDVTSVNLKQDQDSGQSSGFASVTLDTQSEVQEVITQFHASFLAGSRLNVTLAKAKPAAGGYQSQLGAFSAAGHGPPKANPAHPRAAPGGYKSRLSAYGAGSPPPQPRRRGRNQRH